MTGFNQLVEGLHFPLTVRQGEETSIKIISDDNNIDFIQLVQVESTLVFRLDQAYADNLNNVTLQVEVTLIDLVGFFVKRVE